MRDSGPPPVASRRWLWVALASHFVLGLGYLLSTAAFEGPDEGQHFRMASYIAQTGELPFIYGTAAEHGALPILDEERMGHHPPLYYTLLAGWMRLRGKADTVIASGFNENFNVPGEPSRHLRRLHGYEEIGARGWSWLRELRLSSLLLGLVTLCCSFGLGRAAFPERPAVADIAVLSMASLPMFSFMGGALDNAVLGTTLCHLTLWVMVVRLNRGRVGWPDGLLLGALCGLALMTKLTSLILLPPLGVLFVACALRKGEARRSVVAAGVALVTILGMTSWFFLRNRALYGDLFGEQAHAAVFAANALPPEELVQHITRVFPVRLMQSLLGTLGKLTLTPPAWFAWFAGGVALLALLGFGEALTRPARRPRWLVLALLSLAALGSFAIILRLNMSFRQAQGRYLMSALGPMALLFGLGLHTLIGQRWRGALGARLLAVGAPLACGAAILVGHAGPAFDPALAPGDAWYASMEHGVTRAPAAPRIELLSPADGARLVDPPRFAWRAADPEAPHDLHLFDAQGRVLLTTHTWLAIKMSKESWTLPESWWVVLPPGSEVFWRVHQVPDRRRGETEQSVPGSAVFRFTRGD